MQTDTTSWRGCYLEIANRLLDSNPGISIPELAQHLDMLTDDAADIAAILQRWAQRAASKPTTCPSSRVWFEHSNTL